MQRRTHTNLSVSPEKHIHAETNTLEPVCESRETQSCRDNTHKPVCESREKHIHAETKHTHEPVCESSETHSCRDEHTRTLLRVQRNTFMQRRTHTNPSASPEKHIHAETNTLEPVCESRETHSCRDEHTRTRL